MFPTPLRESRVGKLTVAAIMALAWRHALYPMQLKKTIGWPKTPDTWLSAVKRWQGLATRRTSASVIVRHPCQINMPAFQPLLLFLLCPFSYRCLFSALWLKGKGDEFFRSGDYAGAINAYTAAYEGDPSNIRYTRSIVCGVKKESLICLNVWAAVCLIVQCAISSEVKLVNARTIVQQYWTSLPSANRMTRLGRMLVVK